MSLDKTTIARPYAKAIFDLAVKSNQVESWDAFLLSAAAVVLTASANALLLNPAYQSDTLVSYLEKLIKIAFPRELNEQERNLIKLLALNQRLTFLPEIQKLFTQFVEEYHQTIAVTVSSFFLLSQEQEMRLKNKLEKRLNKKISIACIEDKEILGGLVIRAGDFVIDGSIKGQLEKLKKQLAA